MVALGLMAKATTAMTQRPNAGALQRRYGHATSDALPEIVWVHTVVEPDSMMTIAVPERWVSQNFDYGVRDAKGRVIGGFVQIDRIGHWIHAPFYVTHNSLRDGVDFGASPNGTRCKTLEEAQALAVKKAHAARTRFHRLAAKGVGRQFAR